MSFEAAEWSEQLTSRRVGLARRCRRRFVPRSCHFLLFLFSSLLFLSSLSRPIFLLSTQNYFYLGAFQLPFSFLQRWFVLAALSFSLLSLLSPSDQPHSTVSVRTVALKLVTKPFLLKRPSGLSGLTSRRGGLVRRCRPWFDPCSCHFLLFPLSSLLFLSSLSIQLQTSGLGAFFRAISFFLSF